MKIKNRKILMGICFIFIFVIGGLIWWNAPCSITNIEPSEVSKIEIFNGNTGKSITISNTSEIKHIINNTNTVSLKKEKISLWYSGYSFRTTVYKKNGDVYKEFIINSNDTIRRDPFFYKDSTGSIDYKYIKNLF